MVGNVPKVFGFWPSNLTSKNYYQENNHGYLDKFRDNLSIVWERERGKKEEKKLTSNNKQKENCETITPNIKLSNYLTATYFDMESSSQ